MQKAMNELDLKMIYSPYSTISRVCLCFCFDSCNMSQNVTFCYYQHEVNSKFRVTDTKLYVLFFQNHFMKQFPSCENQRKSWVKNSNCLKDKVWIASIHFPNLVPRVSHLTAPWSERGGSKMRDPGNEVVAFRGVRLTNIGPGVPRLCMDWKSSLSSITSLLL